MAVLSFEQGIPNHANAMETVKNYPVNSPSPTSHDESLSPLSCCRVVKMPSSTYGTDPGNDQGDGTYDQEYGSSLILPGENTPPTAPRGKWWVLAAVFIVATVFILIGANTSTSMSALQSSSGSSSGANKPPGTTLKLVQQTDAAPGPDPNLKTNAPTAVASQAPTQGNKPINPQVVFLGPTDQGTAIVSNTLVGGGIALPDDFQLQFDFMSQGVVSGTIDNILHVTTGTDNSDETRESMNPAVYVSATNSLFIEWQVYKSGVGSVTTNVVLTSNQWYTIYLTVQQSKYSVGVEIWSSAGILVETATMKINSKMDQNKRSVYVYAADQFTAAANGLVRNIIFREFAFRPTLQPTQAPTSGQPINPPVEYLGPSDRGSQIVAGQQLGTISLPDEFQVQFDFQPQGAMSGTNDNILHLTQDLGNGQDAQQSMVPAIYLSTTGSLFVEWQIYKSGVGSLTTNRPLKSGQWHRVYVSISQVLKSMLVEVYDSENNLLEATDASFNAVMEKNDRNVWVWASDSWSAAANGLLKNVILREFRYRPTQQPTFKPSALPSMSPTDIPTATPSTKPSNRPSFAPSFKPSELPTHEPTYEPSAKPTSKPTTLEPTFIRGTAQPTLGSHPINPEVEFLGPSEQLTPLVAGTLIGSGIALPDDFQVQLTFQPEGVVSGNIDNILHVTTSPDGGRVTQETMVPALYVSPSGSLFVEWQISQEGVGSVTTSRPLQSGQQYTIYISVMMSRMNIIVDVFDAQNKMYDTTNFNFNAKLGEGTRSVWVYASDAFSASANGAIKNVIFREITAMPTDQPTERPSYRPSQQPTAFPSLEPTRKPTHSPTDVPSASPSLHPTMQPTFDPSAVPTDAPTEAPTDHPTDQVCCCFCPSLPSSPSPSPSQLGLLLGRLL